MSRSKAGQRSVRSRARPEYEVTIPDCPPVRIPVSAGTLDGFRAWVHSEECPRHVRLSYLKDQIFVDGDYYGFGIFIPVSATTLDGFRAWALSDEFPERGRISFLDKEIYIDMSPEEIETHSKVKSAISTGISVLNEELDLGEFFPDGVMVANPGAGLSTEPDGTFVKWQSYRSRRVRLIPRKNDDEQYLEVQGRPDWVLEVVSQSSVGTDTRRLREQYHRAGVPEYWLIDARGEEITFQILAHRRTDYVAVTPQEGWHKSRVFGRSFRLERRRNRLGRWAYKLQVKDS